MNCISRPTYGVIIGGLNIFLFVCTIIYIIVVLSRLDEIADDKEIEADAKTEHIIEKSITLLYILLIICLIAIVSSSLLIIGILKKRSKLMKPYVYTAILGIGIHILRVIFGFFTGFGDGVGSVFANLLVGILVLGIQCLIFYPIYTLYKDYTDYKIEQENC